MNDPRIRQFAEILVDYSTRVKKGDVVLINAAGLEALPLVKELYALCLKRGAKYVEYNFSVPEIDRCFYNLANKQQLDHFPLGHIGAAIEGHVLNEVGIAAFVIGFVKRAGVDHHPHQRLPLWHGIAADYVAHPVVELTECVACVDRHVACLERPGGLGRRGEAGRPDLLRGAGGQGGAGKN